jgi:hypothetical protein
MAFEWARPGARCSCIDAAGVRGLIKGEFYTIIKTGIKQRATFKGQPVTDFPVAVVGEASNPSNSAYPGLNGSYALQRFRPLNEAPQQARKKTAQSIETARKKELEHA